MAHVMIVTPAGSNQGTFCLSSQAVAGSRFFAFFGFLLWLFPALAAETLSNSDCLDCHLHLLRARFEERDAA